MNLNCLIVDDEPIAQGILKGFVEDTPNLSVSECCGNAIEAIAVLQQQKIDILFLDIEMPKLSGLGFLRTLKHPPATIITTAYREFALEGFELDVVDYLLKPISFERFLIAINKVKSVVKFEVTKGASEPKSYEYFKVDRKYIKVEYDEILFIEGLSNYVKVNLKDGNLVVYHTLNDLQKLLPNNRFTRIHKSYIVAIDKIKAFGTDYIEIMEKQLTVGKTYRTAFTKLMSNRMK